MIWFLFIMVSIMLFFIFKFLKNDTHKWVTACAAAVLIVVGICGAPVFLYQRFIGSKSDYIFYDEQRKSLVSNNPNLVVRAIDVGNFNMSLAKYKLHSNSAILKLVWYYSPDVLTIEPISQK